MALKKEFKAQVSKETMEVYEGVGAILDAAAAGKKAGLSGAGLIAHIAASSLQPLVTALDGVGGIKSEHDEDLAEALQAHGCGAGLMAAAVSKLVKSEPEAAPVSS